MHSADPKNQTSAFGMELAPITQSSAALVIVVAEIPLSAWA